jgi:hypothetical protein
MHPTGSRTHLKELSDQDRISVVMDALNAANKNLVEEKYFKNILYNMSATGNHVSAKARQDYLNVEASLMKMARDLINKERHSKDLDKKVGELSLQSQSYAWGYLFHIEHKRKKVECETVKKEKTETKDKSIKKEKEKEEKTNKKSDVNKKETKPVYSNHEKRAARKEAKEIALSTTLSEKYFVDELRHMSLISEHENTAIRRDYLMAEVKTIKIAIDLINTHRRSPDLQKRINGLSLQERSYARAYLAHVEHRMRREETKVMVPDLKQIIASLEGKSKKSSEKKEDHSKHHHHHKDKQVKKT